MCNLSDSLVHRSLPTADEMHMPLLWTEEEAELLGEEDGGCET